MHLHHISTIVFIICRAHKVLHNTITASIARNHMQAEGRHFQDPLNSFRNPNQWMLIAVTVRTLLNLLLEAYRRHPYSSLHTRRMSRRAFSVEQTLSLPSHWKIHNFWVFAILLGLFAQQQCSVIRTSKAIICIGCVATVFTVDEQSDEWAAQSKPECCENCHKICTKMISSSFLMTPFVMYLLLLRLLTREGWRLLWWNPA